jgi:sugar phosphate isomerase/epimerase
MDRRDFLMGAIVGAGGMGALAGGGGGAAGEQQAEAELRLSSQEGVVPGRGLRDKVLKLQDWGAVGIELGGGGLAGRVDEVRQALEGTAVRVSAICAGYGGVPISPDPAVRREAADSIKEILTAAGELGSTGMIMVPAFNHHEQLGGKEGREALLELLREVGEHAAEHGTRVLLEPLNRTEAFFLRQLADAASICRDAGHPGVAMMGDFYHMHREETSDLGAFISAGSYLHHVHLASRTRKLPGQDERSFVDGFRGLKMIGYRDYCSLECGVEGAPEVEIPKSFRFLEEQWEMART